MAVEVDPQVMRAGLERGMTRSRERGVREARRLASLRQFFAPPESTQMLAVPKGMLHLSYLSLSDAAHQAVANLVNLQSMQDIPSDKLAILVDFSSSRLTLDGRTIVQSASGTYYSGPRLIIRALEIFKGDALRVGMTPLPGASCCVDSAGRSG